MTKRKDAAVSYSVRTIVQRMMYGQDPVYLASLLGVADRTFDSKVKSGRFTACELFLLADACGYSLQAVPKGLRRDPDIWEDDVR